MNNADVMEMLENSLTNIQTHLTEALKQANSCSHDAYELACYNFHAGSSLLVSTLDGLACYLEIKVANPSHQQSINRRPRVTWSSATFSDPRFSELKRIRDTAEARSVGPVNFNTLRTFAKHYVPLLDLPSADPRGNGKLDIRFQIPNANTSPTKTGPVLQGLLFPLLDDARAAVDVVRGLLHPTP